MQTPPVSSFEHVMAPDDNRRMVGALLRWVYSRPAFLLVLPLVVLIIIAVSIMLVPRAPFFTAGLLLVVIGGVIALSVRRSYRSAVRTLEASHPVGSVYRVGLEPESLTISTAKADLRVSYERYSGVETTGEFVFLRHRNSYSRIVLPPGLLPQIAVDELRSKIASATP